ncbi:MAG: hypothetical protein LBR44_11825 [Clostridiales Family XIII bacterium]|nr:hypothetical protein [Clostridiales Family XIII bacterium]
MGNKQAIYDARLKRVADAVALREPDRVPIVPIFQAFPVFYQNKWNIKDLLEDYHRATDVYDHFYTHFEPDMGWDPTLFFPIDYMERSGITWFRWPGKHFDDVNTMYQYIEGEYMTADEYPEAIRDITRFMMHKWLPRSFSKLSGLSQIEFRNSMWFGHMGLFASFSNPEVRAAFDTLFETGKIVADFFAYVDEYRAHMKEKFGMPPIFASLAFAPFDMIGDTLRGTEPILMDMYEHPDELLEFIDVVTEFAIADMIAASEGRGVPYVYFWLHKGVDKFMSNEHFAKFYWPSLQKCIFALVDAGRTPVIYAEGAYNNRLEFFRDVPKGKVVFDFEYTDMDKAKKILGDNSCIMGNVPAFTLSYGTKQETVDYCKWLIDTCAPGGGYILDTATMVDDAKPENIEAMFETVFTYGAK